MQVMATPKKIPEPSPDPPKRRQINARLPDRLADALEAYLGSHRVPPAASAVALVALEEFLRKAGFPPEPDQP